MIEVGRQENPKVLIVDDEIQVLNSLADLLRKDFHIFATSDVDEAQRILISHSPISVVISDQRMPLLTGTEFLARVAEISPDTARILLTGYSDIDAVVEAVNIGQIVQYITKPWDTVTLLELLKTIAEKHHLIQDNRQLIQKLADFKELVADSTARIETLTGAQSTLQSDNQTLKTAYEQLDKSYRDLKRHEEALHKSEDKQRSIINTAMDGFWLANLQGDLLEVNETYCPKSTNNIL